MKDGKCTETRETGGEVRGRLGDTKIDKGMVYRMVRTGTDVYIRWPTLLEGGRRF